MKGGSNDNPLQPMLHTILILYCLTGMFGAVWISDEFDYPRAMVIAAVGIPALTVYLLLHHCVRDWSLRWPVWHKLILATVVFSFAWGQLVLINALGDAKPERVHYSSVRQAVSVTANRGPLGLLYKKRW